MCATYDDVSFHTHLADIRLGFLTLVSLCIARTQRYSCVCCADRHKHRRCSCSNACKRHTAESMNGTLIQCQLDMYESLLPCARMRSRVMHLVASVCVRTYVHIYVNKNRLFSALLLKNLLLSVMRCLLFKFKRLQCGLLRPASCTNRVIHAFPNKTWMSPWPRNIFF